MRSRPVGFVSVSPPQGGGAPGDPLFFDDFNYTVNRTDSGATKTSAFVTSGPYTDMKDEQTHPGQAAGYLYTVSSIEGDSSGIPGGGRALCMEARPEPVQWQTDFFLQLGNGSAGSYPADIWFQMWMYIQSDAGSGKETTVTGRNKLIYPLMGTRSGYPTDNFDVGWLQQYEAVAYVLSNGTTVNQPHPAAIAFMSRGQWAGEAHGSRAFHPHLSGTGVEDYLAPNLNVPDTESRFIMPNEWHLIRFHFDISGAQNSDTSKYEVWWRKKGEQSGGLVKKIEWIGGQSAAFSYHNRNLDNQGLKLIRFPTTIGDATGDEPFGEAWFYWKDLAIAATADDLPTYGSY